MTNTQIKEVARILALKFPKLSSAYEGEKTLEERTRIREEVAIEILEAIEKI